MKKNNSSFGTTANSATSLDLSVIGQANDIWFFNGKISSIIIYDSDKTSEESAINVNINERYNDIY